LDPFHLDPFHVVAWATKALDEVRRGVWNELRRTGKPAKQTRPPR
jgi:transposase